jgi:hypothetical protein
MTTMNLICPACDEPQTLNLKHEGTRVCCPRCRMAFFATRRLAKQSEWKKHQGESKFSRLFPVIAGYKVAS